MSLLYLLVALPAVAGLLAFGIPHNQMRRLLWVATAAAHFALSVKVVFWDTGIPHGHWIGIDPLSAIFLPVTSLLFFLTTIYGIGYVSREPAAASAEKPDGALLRNTTEAGFTGFVLLFLSSMTLSIISRQFGLQWVAIEATTLSSAPLIYHHRNRHSLEAAWKYLLLCSVGIALALMGLLFLTKSMPAGMSDFSLQALLSAAPSLDHKWLGIAFIFILVGYGTKMGLAPLHTWLPDAHGEAPSPVSALLSGALLNCAFLGILRVHQVCIAAGMPHFSQSLLIGFGLVSMGFAGALLLMATDYKRMLAYSSIEHVGILALGVGIGGLGAFGALFHAVNHSIVKALLFMAAGNILARFHTKNTSSIKGLCKSMPITGALWLIGFLAITGTPPFGTFVSEFTILTATIARKFWGATALYLFFLLLAFIGMSVIMLKMAFGDPSERPEPESGSSVIPPMVFAILALFLGVYLPSQFAGIFHDAAALIGGAVR